MKTLLTLFVLLFSSSVFANDDLGLYSMPSSSMEPTLLVDEQVIVKKNYYKENEPTYGEIVIFTLPKENSVSIKRIIGLPGDKIQITNGQIILNNTKIIREKTDDFIDIDKNGNLKKIRKYKEYFKNIDFEVLDLVDNWTADNTEVYEVPTNHFFVMGDNRDMSRDSRFVDLVGYIPKENILHKVVSIYFSEDESRIGLILK